VTRSDEERVADILDAADELAAVVGRGREAFGADPILRRAAERLLEIVGEAVNSLSQAVTSRYPDVAWRDIARLPIVLAHHYHRGGPEQVLTIAEEHMPALADAVPGSVET
jgi:uncharacterized protein with HEPN domain